MQQHQSKQNDDDRIDAYMRTCVRASHRGLVGAACSDVQLAACQLRPVGHGPCLRQRQARSAGTHHHFHHHFPAAAARSFQPCSGARARTLGSNAWPALLAALLRGRPLASTAPTRCPVSHRAGGPRVCMTWGGQRQHGRRASSGAGCRLRLSWVHVAPHIGCHSHALRAPSSHHPRPSTNGLGPEGRPCCCLNDLIHQGADGCWAGLPGQQRAKQHVCLGVCWRPAGSGPWSLQGHARARDARCARTWPAGRATAMRERPRAGGRGTAGAACLSSHCCW